MKRKIFSILLALVLVCSFSLIPAVPAAAADPTTIPSSTMVFESVPEYTLTYNGETGIYEGMIPMVYMDLPPGDGVPGYDLYARETFKAWFGNDPGDGPVWTSVTIANHDAFPSWDPDTPDWDGYSLMFYVDDGVQKWRVANHSGTGGIPWYTPAGSGEVEQGVPMSGTMDWTAMYAAETDVGEYLYPIDPLTHPEIPGGAVDNGGGAACWDMDWSWGSEVIPLQFPGFNVVITDTGTGMYMVALIPGAPAPELDKDWYRTGDTVEVTVEDASVNNPLQRDTVNVIAVSDTDTFGNTVTLTETDFDTGVFEGSFLLAQLPLVLPPNPGEVVVTDGDEITVTYLGATDTATVDNTPPVISNVSPVDGAIVPSATPTISATLGDVGSGIDIATGVMAIDGTPDVGATVTLSDISYTPGIALSQGVHNVTVDVFDVAGNAATQVSWSFTVDTGVPGVTSVLLNPDPPYVNPTTNIAFTLTFSEPMDTSVLPTVTFGLLTPFDTHPVTNIGWSTDEGVWYWGGRFTIPSWGPALDGEQTLSVSGAQDLVGNVMLTDTSTTFVIDLNAPIPPDYILAFVNQNPPGIADSVQGDPGAVEGGALVEVWAEVGLTNLIGSVLASGGGSFHAIDIGDNQHSAVWVTATDAVGHRSAATVLYNDIAGPLITSGTWSVNAGQPNWVLEGQVIDVTIIGEPGCTATFDIGEIAVGVSAPEIFYGAGIYTGSYTVLDGDNVKNAPMQYHLTDAVGNIYLLGILMGPSIDTIVPTIDTLTPADGTYVDTATPEISAVLDDNLSGVDQTSIVMTVSGATGSVTYSPSTPTGGIVYFYPDSDLAEGSHTVTLDVSDVAGNPATQAISWSFTVDTIDPIITIDPVTTPTDVELHEIKGTFTELNLYNIVTTFNGWEQVVNISGTNWTAPTLVHLQQGDNLIVATITDLAGNSAFAEATIHLDTEAPVVTVTTPNGGESLLGGSMYNITWAASDANFITDPITIEYSVDSGKSWNNVATSEVNDGGYLWTVPKLDSSDCLVRVTGTDSFGSSGSDVSDAVFTITTSAPDTSPPTVTVNSPNGGESWQGGSTQTITWTATDDKTPSGSLLVDLYYSSDGGTVWTSIASIAANNGSYSWSVPGIINSSQCLVRVEASDTSGNVGFDISNTVFTITTPGEPAAPVETIELKTGWNLVSLMLIPTNSNITDVLEGIDVVSVWAYDASIEDPAERWSSYAPGAPGDLETMVDGRGYWIEISADAMLEVQGEELPAPPTALPAYSVVEGWNLIGFKSTTPRTVDSYLLAIDGKYTLVRGYEGSYFTVGTGENLDPGFGYWIAITESGTIYP